MFVFALLLVLLVIACITDFREQKIYNWTTYPGMLVGLLVSGILTWLGRDSVSGSSWDQTCWGGVSFTESVAGLLICGFLMLVCFVFFPTGVGGGDVKLLAMMGAFLGVQRGLEAMLWTFVLGGFLALCLLIWREGVGSLLRTSWRAFQRLLPGVPRHEPTNDQEGNGDGGEPKSALYLSPSALLAALIVGVPPLLT